MLKAWIVAVLFTSYHDVKLSNKLRSESHNYVLIRFVSVYNTIYSPDYNRLLFLSVSVPIFLIFLMLFVSFMCPLLHTLLDMNYFKISGENTNYEEWGYIVVF